MHKKKDILDFIKPAKIETPDQDFFDQLANKVVQENPKIVYNRSQGPKIVKWSLAAAAAFLLGVLLFKNLSHDPIPQKTVKTEFLADINDAEIYNYVDEHIDDFTLEEIEEVIIDEDFGLYDLENTSELDFYFSDISDEEISTYINEEFIDLDEFEDELLIF